VRCCNHHCLRISLSEFAGERLHPRTGRSRQPAFLWGASLLDGKPTVRSDRREDKGHERDI